MTPQEIRNLRLKNDYKEMVNIKGSIISWEATKGTPPYVEEYNVTINIRGIVGEGPKYRNSHIIYLKLPPNYPIAAPQVEMISKPIVYHPNWYRAGKWCYGTWLMSEGLGHHIIRMIRTLQYDLDITNENSPANSSANSWYKSHKRSGIFPCDSTILPDPTKKKMTMQFQTKKKFKIN